MQIRDFTGGKKRPVAVGLDSLHKKIRNPVGGVHIMGSSTVITGIFAQLKKLFDVQMPDLQIRAHRPLTFSSLVDRQSRIISDF